LVLDLNLLWLLAKLVLDLNLRLLTNLYLLLTELLILL